MQNYREYNDSELLYLIKENDEVAYNIMYEKYRPYIFKLANKFSHTKEKNGIDTNDLIIEGYMGLEKAIECQHKYKNVNFTKLVSLFVSRYMITFIRKANLNKYKSLNSSLFIEEINPADGEADIMEVIEDKNSIKPFDEIINSDLKRYLYNELSPKLTENEQEVFKLLLNGYDYREISKILNKPLKSIRNTMDRIHKKSNKYIKID